MRIRRHGPVLNPNGMPNLGTLGGGILDGSALHIHCDRYGCNHSREFDLRQLAQHLGYEHGALRHHLAPLFRCSKCDSKNVRFITTPNYDAPKAAHLSGVPYFTPEILYRKGKR